MTVVGQVIRMKEIGIVFISLAYGNIIELYNIALAFGYNSNLISPGQPQKTGITYHNDLKAIMLMK